MTDGPKSPRIQVVRTRRLRPFWGNVGTDLPGHARWGVTPIGGPPGFEHQNRDEDTVVTEACTVGFMAFPPGISSPGLHVHVDVNEVYIVTAGELAVKSEHGEEYLGQYDVAFIPAGTPHGVRNAGLEDVHFFWIKTGVEPAGSEVQVP